MLATIQNIVSQIVVAGSGVFLSVKFNSVWPGVAGMICAFFVYAIGDSKQGAKEKDEKEEKGKSVDGEE